MPVQLPERDKGLEWYLANTDSPGTDILCVVTIGYKTLVHPISTIRREDGYRCPP